MSGKACCEPSEVKAVKGGTEQSVGSQIHEWGGLDESVPSAMFVVGTSLL